jgi:uncharacterized protein (DUF2336 family)
MMVRKFLAWAATAPAAERASAAASLARALLERELPAEEEHEAGIALSALADDASPLVRRAIAAEIASRPDAPRQILIALAADQPDIAIPVLRFSPALADSDLIDAAIVGAADTQMAIALRDTVSAPVCAALVEVGARDALIALLDNVGACVPENALARIVERFADDAPVREALLARHDLAPRLRARLVDAAAETLRSFVVSCGWMSGERADRATREAREKGYVILASVDAGGASAMAGQLRQAGRLTAALLLRSLLSGETRLLEAALADLGGVPSGRAAAHVANYNGSAFAALYRRAGLPEALLDVFRFALHAIETAGVDDEFADGGLQRRLVETVLADCERGGASGAQPVMGLLRRFYAEAARQEAREFAAWLARTQAMAAIEDGGQGREVAAVTATPDWAQELPPVIAESTMPTGRIEPALPLAA